MVMQNIDGLKEFARENMEVNTAWINRKLNLPSVRGTQNHQASGTIERSPSLGYFQTPLSCSTNGKHNDVD